MTILPQVKSMTIHEGTFVLPHLVTVKTDKRSQNAFGELNALFSCVDAEEAVLCFEIDPLLRPQAYQINIDKERILIRHQDEAGAFYAIKTLKQIFAQNHDCPCLVIEDEPDLQIRGYLLDISRNKIPTLKTLFGLIDVLSDLKYNHFELYVEGFSFLYPSFQSLYTDETPITVDDFKKLETYCNEKCIDFVPNHNGLGHMSAWLARPEFKSLAAIEEGMVMWGAHRDASTLNPLDPRSLALVKTYTSDILSISKSPYFHLNLDEPYELGEGKTKEAAEKIGIGQLYLDYVLKLYDHVKSYGKIPLVWGDVLNHYPELLSKLPKDLIFVDWGYDSDAPFYQSLKRLSTYDVSFMSAPGTSSWNSITGRTADSMENIHNACLYTKLYHGLGFLLTDWGDNGHLQPLSVSYLPMVYGSAESWSSSAGSYRHCIDYLNDVIFKDRQKMMGEVLADLGRYARYQTEYRYNATQILDVINHSNGDVPSFINHLKDHPFSDPVRANLMIEEFNLIKKRLKTAQCESKLGKAAAHELSDTIELLKVLIKSFEIASPLLTDKQRQTKLTALKKAWPIRLKRYRIHWLKNNRVGGLKDSLAHLESVARIIKQMN